MKSTLNYIKPRLLCVKTSNMTNNTLQNMLPLVNNTINRMKSYSKSIVQRELFYPKIPLLLLLLLLPLANAVLYGQWDITSHATVETPDQVPTPICRINVKDGATLVFDLENSNDTVFIGDIMVEDGGTLEIKSGNLVIKPNDARPTVGSGGDRNTHLNIIRIAIGGIFNMYGGSIKTATPPPS